MSTEKMREEFETSFVANLVERHGEGFRVDAMELLKEKAPSGEYENYTPFIAWWAWQASRAAIEVEWPDQHTYTVPDCAGAAILDCRTAFNKAVKVKP